MPVADTSVEDEIEKCRIVLAEEIDVVKSIYPESLVIYNESSGNSSLSLVRLDLPIDLGGPTTVEIADDGTISASSAAVMHDAPPGVGAGLIQTVGSTSGRSPTSTVTVEVSHLPSLLVDIQLPPTYPLLSAPTSIEVKSSQSWLSDSLCERLRGIIDGMSGEQLEMGEGILVRILDLALSGDVLHSLSLYHADDPAMLELAHATPHLLAPLLSAYDRSRKLAQFSQLSFECNICLEYKKGSKCFALSCNHVFCQECLREFWGLHIKEGDVDKVACANAECVKAKRQVGEAEVRMVISDAEVLRWKWLKLKKAVENDPTIVHCPIPICQAAVPRPESLASDDFHEQESHGWERLRTCPSCGYSFCVFCKRAWHGPHTLCASSTTMGLLMEYIAAADGSPERAAIERLMGRANIRRMVVRHEEEDANRKWMESSTMACPGCGVKVQKSMGCNHMTCARCAIHFCYICGAKLPPNEPYKHFSTQGDGCYNRLFDAEAIQWDPLDIEGVLDE